MSAVTTVPGFGGTQTIITDECRANRTDAGAVEEAIARLRRELELSLRGWPAKFGTKFHIVLTIERSEALP